MQQQIRDQVLYIAQDSIENALAWEDRLQIAIQDIGAVPGHAIDEEASQRLGYAVRKTTFEGTYLIHYFVDEQAKAVRIVNFRHGARLPKPSEP